MKLVLEVVDTLGYTRISNGFFRFGRYSFVVDGVFDQLKYEKSLQGVKIHPSEIDATLSLDLGGILARYKEFFISDPGKEMPWRYADTVPKKYINFYAVYAELQAELKKLSEVKGKKDILACCESIPAIITRFEFCLLHVDEENLKMYYEYTGVLENILVAIKNQTVPLTSVKPILAELNEIYKTCISAVLPPFVDTLDGKNTDKEIFMYRQHLAENAKIAHHKLQIIEEKAQRMGLIP